MFTTNAADSSTTELDRASLLMMHTVPEFEGVPNGRHSPSMDSGIASLENIAVKVQQEEEVVVVAGPAPVSSGKINFFPRPAAAAVLPGAVSGGLGTSIQPRSLPRRSPLLQRWHPPRRSPVVGTPSTMSAQTPRESMPSILAATLLTPKLSTPVCSPPFSIRRDDLITGVVSEDRAKMADVRQAQSQADRLQARKYRMGLKNDGPG